MKATSKSIYCFYYSLIYSFVLCQNEVDKLALLAIKNQLVSDPFGVTSSWNESLNFCMWHGVSCKRQRVTQLNLSSSSLVGYVPSSIANLSFLQVLDLSNNSFQGQVPEKIGHLFRLRVITLANNSLSGQIPTTLSNCSNLKTLDLSYNNFMSRIPFQLGFLTKLEQLRIRNSNLEGIIPPHIGNISTLLEISLRINKLEGEIPESLGQLKSLTILSIGDNMLSGTIPKSIYNLSHLSLLSLCKNKFQGSFPHNIGLTLPNLQYFNVWENQFSGSIPSSFSNTSKLLIFDISNNKFFGGVPNIFRNQDKLRLLWLADNDLGTSGINDDLKFLTDLANCSSLEKLNLSNCNFGGVLPSSLVNLSGKLESLSMAGNQISGTIPPGIGNLVSLNEFLMYDNKLKGALPETIGKLHMLERVHLHANEFYGEIPFSIGNLSRLSELRLDENNFHGNIPSSLENCKSLLWLDLSSNSFNGTIPPNVIGLSSLSKSLNLSRNYLSGSLPWEVGNLKNLVELDVSKNNLSGDIPSSLGDCTILQRLNMDHNKFEGVLPETLYSLKGIEEIDLSYNNLSGHISKDLAKLSSLSKLNLSFNDLEGELPTGGVFGNFSGISISGNDKLCGGIPELELRECFRKHNLSFEAKLTISICCALVVLLLLYAVIYYFLRKSKRKALKSYERDPVMNISYGELLKATNGFSPNNMIGQGGFGSVYKGILGPHQTIVAVKVFNLVNREATKSFMTECEILRSVRHRNLVKIIDGCSGVDYQGNDFKALIYEFMPNGSLEDWLHSIPAKNSEEQEKSLNLSQRLNVVIDVASALDYLHNHNQLHIVHCDLKPSNILLDQNMTAHVSDFGLSRIIIEDSSINQTSSIGIKGTIGYAAPEYGMGSKVTTQGDVYSFGILLLEIFTGKRPTYAGFKDELNLNRFVKTALPERVMEVVDSSLVFGEEEERATTSSSSSSTLLQTRRGKVDELLVSILKVGVMCSEISPRNRIQINDALNKLHEIRNLVLKDELV
ncbi:hypothetical protein CsatA_004928 [Cannabis sativa]